MLLFQGRDPLHTSRGSWWFTPGGGLGVPARVVEGYTAGTLDPNTGTLKWYFQHLPGDDWDEDYANERTLLRTKLEPNPKRHQALLAAIVGGLAGYGTGALMPLALVPMVGAELKQ